MLYLEAGSIPIRFIVIFKRVMFLHYILNQDQDSLIRRVFEAQVRNPSRNDWSETVKKDLEELKIVKTLGGIEKFKSEAHRAHRVFAASKCSEYSTLKVPFPIKN